MFAARKNQNLVEYENAVAGAIGVDAQNGLKAMQPTPPSSERCKPPERRDHSDSDSLFEEGLRCYRKCFGFMKEHWADFPVSDRTKALEWKDLLAGFKHKIVALRSREMRDEIQALWEKSYLGEAQKRLSAAYRACDEDDVSEAALRVLRDEMRSLRAYHHRHKVEDSISGSRGVERGAPAVRRELIDLLRQYEMALKSLDAVSSTDEQLANAHERLTNRGALLLREERHRKLLAKLPQMQKTILRMIKEKEKQGEVFLVNGEHFETIMERDKKLIQMKVGSKHATHPVTPSPTPTPPSRSASTRRARSGASSRAGNGVAGSAGTSVNSGSGAGGGNTTVSLRAAAAAAAAAAAGNTTVSSSAPPSPKLPRCAQQATSARNKRSITAPVTMRTQQQRNGGGSASPSSPAASTVSCSSPPSAGMGRRSSQHPMRGKKSNTTTICTSRRGQHLRSGYFSS